MSVTRWTILATAAVFSLAPEVRAQTYAPYSDFQNLTPAELASLQVKLTYVGQLDSPVRSLVFTSTSGTIDVAAFTPYQRPGFFYGMDSGSPATFTVAPAILDAMIDSVAALPQVTDGGVDSSGYISFAMIETSGATRAFESILNQANGQAAVTRILAALASQPMALRAVSEAGCRMSIMTDNPPTDVTANVTIKVTGFRRVQGTDEFVGKINVKNTSGSTLVAPLTLLPRALGANVALVGEQGLTCAILPGGERYVDLPIGTGLAPNASVEITLRIKNPSLERVNVQPKVFAGPGTR